MIWRCFGRKGNKDNVCSQFWDHEILYNEFRQLPWKMIFIQVKHPIQLVKSYQVKKKSPTNCCWSDLSRKTSLGGKLTNKLLSIRVVLKKGVYLKKVSKSLFLLKRTWSFVVSYIYIYTKARDCHVFR
jgi:hypothetical protein